MIYQGVTASGTFYVYRFSMLDSNLHGFKRRYGYARYIEIQNQLIVSELIPYPYGWRPRQGALQQLQRGRVGVKSS